MSDMSPAGIKSIEPKVVSSAADEAWREHRRGAVREFLKNVVVIDNEPIIGGSAPVAEVIANVAVSATTSAPASQQDEQKKWEQVQRPSSPVEATEEEEHHPLDIRVVSDAFAENGIACAFVLPADEDVGKDAEARIKNRVLKATKSADLVVIDWYLRGNNPALTIEILKEIARMDVAERGRMRLICIYTGQDIGKGIFQGATAALAEGGITVTPVAGVPNAAKSVNCLLLVMNKNELAPTRLPNALVDAFTHLADGLLPSFALAAVGAVRNNVHHMVTRFGPSLDGAYVANRMITNPPGDVAELIRELFVAECDNALGLDRVADRFLEGDPITKWMDVREVPHAKKEYKYKKGDETTSVSLDRSFLDSLNSFGVTDTDMYLDGDGKKQPFKEDKRQFVSHVLASSQEQAVKVEQDFARLVILRREAFGSTKINDGTEWRPSLTTGSLVKLEGPAYFGSSYFICLTPACDTLRLSGQERFVFIGNVVEDKKVNFVVADEDGETKKLYFPHDRPNLATFLFVPDETTKRVQAAQEIAGDAIKFSFKTAGEEVLKLLWLGEVRYARATSDVSKVVGNWMRIGVNDSEYLRLSARGKATL